MRAHFRRNWEAYFLLCLFVVTCILANNDSPYHYGWGSL